MKKIFDMVINIDLTKGHDKEIQMHLRLMVLHFDFNFLLVKWMEGCKIFSSLYVLINELRFIFFISFKGLRKVLTLSPPFFFIILEGLNTIFINYSRRGRLRLINIDFSLSINHLLFVDDATIFDIGCYAPNS